MQFLEDIFGAGSPKEWSPEHCWQDREIRFDVHPRELKCRPAEDIIETMDPVEDTKVCTVQATHACIGMILEEPASCFL